MTEEEPQVGDVYIFTTDAYRIRNLYFIMTGGYSNTMTGIKIYKRDDGTIDIKKDTTVNYLSRRQVSSYEFVGNLKNINTYEEMVVIDE